MPTGRLPFSNFRGFAQRKRQGLVESQTEVYLPPWGTVLLGLVLAALSAQMLLHSWVWGGLLAVIAFGTFRDGWTANRRGCFRFNGEEQVLEWHKRDKSVRRCPFSEISRVSTSFDWIGPFGRLRWLVLQLRDGSRMFIASGRRDELDALGSELRALGVPTPSSAP